MQMSTKKYRNLSLSDEFVKEIEKFIEEHPESDFTSIAEFIRYSVRAYIEFRKTLLKHPLKNEEV